MLPWRSPSTWISMWRGLLDQLFDVDFGIAKSALGFAGGVAQGGFQIGLAVHAAHALAAAAGHRLEQDGVAVARGEVAGLVGR